MLDEVDFLESQLRQRIATLVESDDCFQELIDERDGSIDLNACLYAADSVL